MRNAISHDQEASVIKWAVKERTLAWAIRIYYRRYVQGLAFVSCFILSFSCQFFLSHGSRKNPMSVQREYEQ